MPYPDPSDDEIVYLGTGRTGQVPSHPPALRPVTGIMLHVEKTNGEEAHTMMFRKSNSSVVHIGRRSGNDDRRSQDHEPSGAMFRCAVVSRKHAKIVLADSGHAYIFDLGSHHGTHLRKKDVRFPWPLKPETAVMLADGDTVTFGKAVGKGESYVRPVVARVELLYGTSASPATPPIRPLIVPEVSPNSDKSSSAKPTGRYGLTSSSSSDESGSGMYSDIEEIQADEGLSGKPSTFEDASAHPETGSLSSALRALRRILPTPSTSDKPLSAPVPQVPAFSSILNWHPFSGESGQSPEPCSSKRSSLPSISFPSSPHFHFNFLNSPSPNLLTNVIDLEEEDRSRSNSPMDLASPSPTPGLVVSRHLSIPPSPESAPLPLPDVTPIVMSAPAVVLPNETTVEEVDVLPEEDRSCVLPVIQPVQTTLDLEEEIRRLNGDIRRFESDITRLQNHRRKYRSRFNNNVHVISQKLSSFDDRLAEVNAEYTVLYDQVDTIHHVDIPDMQAQLDALQERMDEIPSPFSTPPPEQTPMPFADRDDVKTALKAINHLVDEMRTLRDTTRNEVTAELETLHRFRTEFMAQVSQENAEVYSLIEQARNAAATSQTPVLPSLKRKRDDTDENGEESVSGDSEMSNEIAEGGDEVQADEVMQVDSEADLATSIDADEEVDVPRPRKRARRLASVVARTATGITLGAILTWSALAFA